MSADERRKKLQKQYDDLLMAIETLRENSVYTADVKVFEKELRELKPDLALAENDALLEELINRHLTISGPLRKALAL